MSEYRELRDKLSAALNDGTPDAAREDFEQLAYVNRFTVLDALMFADGFVSQSTELREAREKIAELECSVELKAGLLGSTLMDFIPDAAHVNALPEPVRRYIHDVVTKCDPAGDIQTIWSQRQQLAGLLDELSAMRQRAEQAEVQVTELSAGIHGYIADVHSAKRALEVVIHAQGEQFKLREYAESRVQELESLIANMQKPPTANFAAHLEAKVQELEKQIADHVAEPEWQLKAVTYAARIQELEKELAAIENGRKAKVGNTGDL